MSGDIYHEYGCGLNMMYQNARDIYSSNVSLHDGTTYSHQYKAVLAQIYKTIRYLTAAEDREGVVAQERELILLDGERKGLEKKLLAIYPDIVGVLKVFIGGDRKNIAIAFGNCDAETDGVGTKALFNMLGLPGSEAVAVERTRERVKGI